MVDWNEFASEFRANDRFWYFPHAHVGTATFPRMMGVFAEFEGRVWDQDEIMAALRDAGLTTGDGAGGRMIRKAAENLGLLWFEDSVFWLTPSGHAVALGEPHLPLFENVLWRYQLDNPINTGAVGFSIYPHRALLTVLLETDGYCTRDEFVLFVGRTRTTAELAGTIALIKEWRALDRDDQDIIMTLIEPTFGRRVTDASYSLGFHGTARYLERFDDERRRSGIRFRGKAGETRVKNLLKVRPDRATIEFRSESDCVSFYGDTEKATDASATLDYLLDTSQYEKAVEAFKLLPHQLRRGMTTRQFERAVFLEKDLEDYLVDHLDAIEEGLELVQRQFGTAAGTIDILARSAAGELVVIELKKVRASDKVFGQVCRYMGCIMMHHAADGQDTRGYIVGSDIDQKLRYAASVVPDGRVNLRKFERDDDDGTIFVLAD